MTVQYKPSDDISKAVFQLIPHEDTAHGVDHTLRVWHNAIAIVRQFPKVEMRILEAAIFFHDVGRFINPDSIPHARASANWCRENLAKFGYSDSEVEEISHAISEHSFSSGSEATSTISIILRDADRLDAIGAVGIARIFALGAKRKFYHLQDPFCENREPDDTKYNLDHFKNKLLKLQFQTEYGREEGARRTTVIIKFLDELKQEII